MPGLLRTNLFSKLGGPASTIGALQEAFRDGVSVTAKVLWLPRGDAREKEVKPRWIRATPLTGSDSHVGVWMVILVPIDNEDDFGMNGPEGPMNGLGEGIMDERFDRLSDAAFEEQQTHNPRPESRTERKTKSSHSPMPNPQASTSSPPSTQAPSIKHGASTEPFPRARDAQHNDQDYSAAEKQLHGLGVVSVRLSSSKPPSDRPRLQKFC